MSVSRSATKRGGGGAGCSASASDIHRQCTGSARGGPFQARDDFARARDRYVEVRDEPHAVLPTLRVAQQSFRLASGGESSGAHRQVEVDEEQVRLGRSAAQPADRLYSFRDHVRAAVILFQPLEMTIERVNSGRGENAHLPHATSETFAK